MTIMIIGHKLVQTLSRFLGKKIIIKMIILLIELQNFDNLSVYYLSLSFINHLIIKYYFKKKYHIY
jgi:hypothetical protein